MIEWFNDWFDDYYLKFYLLNQSEELTKKQVKFIIDVLDLKEGSKVLDICCGTGRHLIEFSKIGIKGVGIDFNKKYIKLANKNKVKDINLKFLNIDARQIDFENEFDAAISIWTSFGYFSDAENLNLLKKIHKSLKKNGKLLIDLENIYYLLNNLPKERWEKKESEFILERNQLNLRSSRLKTERIIINNKNKFEYVRDYRIYTLSELEIYSFEAGFKLIKFYGGYEKEELNFSSKRLIVILEKL